MNPLILQAVRTLIPQTARNAWNTLMFRFEPKTLAEYPTKAHMWLLVLVFMLDCILGFVGAYPFLGLITGMIMGVLDVGVLVYIERKKSYAHGVACASALVACQLASIVLNLVSLRGMTLILSIWSIVVLFKLLKTPDSQVA